MMIPRSDPNHRIAVLASVESAELAQSVRRWFPARIFEFHYREVWRNGSPKTPVLEITQIIDNSKIREAGSPKGNAASCRIKIIARKRPAAGTAVPSGIILDWPEDKRYFRDLLYAKVVQLFRPEEEVCLKQEPAAGRNRKPDRFEKTTVS